MKVNVTSRERVLAAVAGEPADHVPFSMEVHPSYEFLINGPEDLDKMEYLSQPATKHGALYTA